MTTKTKAQVKGLPEHIFHAFFAATDDKVQLKIKVADKSGIKAYGFAYDGAPVPMSGGSGVFLATRASKKLLEWVMEGNPGGTMNVAVTRGADIVKEREKSTIQPPETKGYDAFEIEVN